MQSSMMFPDRLSGFCSLLYQVIWVRMAFASFGVITPVLSVVLSVFMLGLGLGSFLGGRIARAWDRSHRSSLAVLYGFCEFTIGIGALIVPFLFSLGDQALLQAGEMSSIQYLVLSALVIAASILPSCVMMGATFPLMMGFIRQTPGADESSFSFLYVANVSGAMAGTALTALVLVETLGFRRTTQIAAVANFSIALISFALAGSVARRVKSAIFEGTELRNARRDRWTENARRDRWTEIVLFTTGFASLAMEVVWTRAFTFVLATTIYSFAAVLTTYLLATWIGSCFYRYDKSRNRLISTDRALAMACLVALVPVIVGDPRLNNSPISILAGIAPFCLALGYLTPRLVDEYSQGLPAEAGRCYAINILGGILGPLVAAYALLPYVGVRGAFLALSIPLFLLLLWAGRTSLTKPETIAVMTGFAALFGRL
jgi:spermidine synthase